jgi:anaerobic selenocysteine-containing dehydrogenase
MSQEKKLTRRDVLKLAGVGGAVAAVLSGCGPMSRYVRRKPYTDMPEYQLPGESVYFATLCRECPAGCGILVRTVEGRAIKVEGNPQHPVNRGRPVWHHMYCR